MLFRTVFDYSPIDSESEPSSDIPASSILIAYSV